MRHRLIAPLACGLALALAACGDDDDKDTAGTTTEATTAAETPAASPQAPTKPKVTYEKRSEPPSKLVVKDLEKGSGPAVAAGDTAVVHYVGVDYGTGKQFDASYDNGQTFPVPVGAGQVIPGWDRGLVGMKVGGRRQLIVPPKLAYGEQGSPPAIGPNATLVFVIDLLAKQ